MLVGRTLIVLIIAVVGAANGQLLCYSCRGSDCAVPSLDQVEECDASSLIQTTTEGTITEPTTDSDMNFDTEVVQVAEYPLLENFESSEEDTYVQIITSRLPGDSFTSRKLQQSQDQVLRCIRATYIEQESGALSTIRACAIQQEDDDSTCRSQVMGDLVTCYVCDTDFCNSALKLTATATILLPLFNTLRNV